MSLLMVRIPRRSLISQENIDLDDVQFQWTFISDFQVEQPLDHKKTGISSIAFMPKADQAIVFISTLDVRLLTMKIPLVNDEKIQMIMPGLLEDRLLGNVDRFDYKILNPIEGDPALDRTVAVMDKHWIQWVSSKVHELNIHRVRLLPDCCLLDPIESGQSYEESPMQASPNIAYEVSGNQVIWTVRLTEQTGASWVDQINHLTDHDDISALLPTKLKNKTIVPFDWSSDWVFCSLQRLAGLSDDDGVNLLSNSYQAANPKQARDSIKYVVLNFFGEWFSQSSWSSNKLLLIFAPLSFFAGYIIYGAAILLINHGFNYQMNALANGNLNEPAKINIQSSIHHFLEQHREQKRLVGELNQADFQMMSADLRRLTKTYGEGGIKKIDYKGSSIEFEFKPDFLKSRKITPAKIVYDAATLDMLVIALGEDRFKLLPYAGLGYGL